MFQNSCQNLALVGWCFFWGVVWGGGRLGGVAVWRRGVGGAVAWWGWPCVSCVVFDVLLCILTKCFFRVCFCFSSACCRLLPGEFFPLLCQQAWLAVAFFRSGLLCTAELRFSDRFFRSVFPHCGNVFLQSKKVR